MQRLKNWDAKRSGAAMTVIGVDTATNKAVKLTEVANIGSADSKVIATIRGTAEQVELVS